MSAFYVDPSLGYRRVGGFEHGDAAYGGCEWVRRAFTLGGASGQVAGGSHVRSEAAVLRRGSSAAPLGAGESRCRQWNAGVAALHKSTVHVASESLRAAAREGPAIVGGSEPLLCRRVTEIGCVVV
jgi:hypothetical protein